MFEGLDVKAGIFNSDKGVKVSSSIKDAYISVRLIKTLMTF